MSQVDLQGFAILLILLGLLFFLAVRLWLKFAPRYRQGFQPEAALSEKDLVSDHGEAVLVVNVGGRIKSINSKARQIFRLQEGETPNIERLARRVRPGETFIRLCAHEGQGRFLLDGRLVEGTSYQITSNLESITIVSLCYPEITTGLVATRSGLSAQTLQTFTELTQAMAASLDLSKTLQAILENVEKIIPADFMEISVWDSESDVLTPYRLTGTSGVDRTLLQSPERYQSGQGLNSMVFQQRQPLLVQDIDAQRTLKSAVELSVAPLRSFLGVPLVAGNDGIGVLSLGSMDPDMFGEDDLGLTVLLSGQAAIALHNALLYQTEQKRTAELSGLAQLAQAFSSIRSPTVVFGRLVDSIVPLLSVEILGFLVYDESHHMLVAQMPFHGLPDQIVQLFQANVPLGSAAERIMLDQDILITENAAIDEKWAQLGLEYISQAASLRETVLVPLSSAGHMQGYLQASNHVGGSIPFSQAELHLLMIVANQAASIIENIALIQQSRLRAQRAEALRRVASLASSAATLDEIFKFSLQELARLLHADVAAVFLLNQEHTQFEFHQVSVFGILPELPERSMRLAADDPQFQFTVAGNQQILSIDNISQGEHTIIPFYQTLLRIWKIESIIIVPLVIRDEGIGEMWFGNLENRQFEQGDVQVVATAGGQLAGVVEQSFLRSQTDESLRRRVDQMVAINRVSRELSTSLDLNSLINLVYDEALRTTRADCGSILLFDLEDINSQSLSVHFFVGDVPEIPLTALNRQALQRDGPLHIVDLSRSEYPPPHPGIQSTLIVPILYQRRHAGLICLHGKLAGQFDETALEISQSLAVQAAVALNNAIAYEEKTRRGMILRRELDTLSHLIQVSRTIRPSQSLKHSLLEIAHAIQASTPFQVVLISVYEPEANRLERFVGAGVSPEAWEDLKAHHQSWQSLQQLLLPEYKVGDLYYITEDKIPPNLEDVHVVNVVPASEDASEAAWHQRDLVLVPLLDINQNPVGLLSVDAPADQLRPDYVSLNALELFAAQASIMIESQQHAERLERQIEALSDEMARLQKSALQAQISLPVLLHKELDQAVVLRALNQRIERIQATVEIAALVNRQVQEEEMLRTFASGMITHFAMHSALIAEFKSTTGVRLLEAVGSFPANVNLEALFGQRNPLHQILQEKGRSLEDGILLIPNISDNLDWRHNTLLTALDTRSLIGMRLDLGNDHMAGVLVLGQRAIPSLLENDRQIFSQLAHQISVGLQNLQLLNETRRRLRDVDLLLDFSRKLGSLQPAEIFTSLIENVIQIFPKADAGWVGTWDEKIQAIIPQAATGYASNQDILDIRYSFQDKIGDFPDSKMILPHRVLRTGQPERVGEVNFSEQYHLSSNDLLRYRRATNGQLPISAMVIPLQAGENVLGVLFLESFEIPAAFTAEDEALASSFARQATMVLENARLYQASEIRATQLQALTKVAETITSSLQREELISSLLDQLKLVLPYDTATLWLRSEESLVVAAATGFPDSDSRLDLSVAVQDSALFKMMISASAPISVGDLRSDERFPKLIDPEYLSWLGIPLIYKSEVIGLIALEKREADFYDKDFIQSGTTFASQAAVSLENARLYSESIRRAAELDERSHRLALLNRLSGELVASLDIENIVNLTAEQLLTALSADGIVSVMIDGQQKYIVQYDLPAQNGAVPILLPASTFFDHLQETRGIFQTDNIGGESSLLQLWEAFFQARQARSLLVLPLIAGSAMQGWYLVYRIHEYRYTLPEIELGQTMCNQSAVAMQNARLFGETRRLTADLERRVEERTKELRGEHQNSQTLLHIITELSTSLDMGLVLNRTLNVLNESLGSEESGIILSHGSMSYHSGIRLAQMDNPGMSVMAVERQIAGWVVRTRKPVLTNRVHEDVRWEIPTQAVVAYQSVLAVPLVMGEDVLGALLLFHRAADFFSQNRIPLVEAVARQIGIALNNAELFNLIRDQSEHLGNMLREQQIDASRSRAILEAVADGVLVIDANDNINLLNASAEKILNLDSEQAIGKSLDQFSGLFGKTASEWMKAIRRWSQDPLASRGIETYAEQVDLGNGRIIAVHLAPVFWRQEFLGTVSIFRDITREVQVDRLKSEFVANVSHELRTPMTSIKGYVDVILMGAAGKINPQQEQFMKIVKSNTERLGGLVDDLLNISRIESGHVAFRLQPINLFEIAKDVIADFQRHSQEENRPMSFYLESQPELPFASGDYEQVRQILHALVSNGYFYTPENGWVRVAVRDMGKEIQVDVSDNGIGITQEEKQRIFERFYRGEDPLVLASAGTGLGLAIAKTLVEMHNGKIWFESSGIHGQGSIFSFTLPVYENRDTD